MLAFLIVIVSLLAAILLVLCIIAQRKLSRLKQMHEELLHDHRSALVKHGMSFEQLFPFMKNYTYDPRNFRFIGDPIDGISFEDDGVVFIEFKTGKSSLSHRQKNIKEAVNNKKVKWKEIRES